MATEFDQKIAEPCMTSTSEKLGQLDGTREDHECNRQQSPFRVVAKPEGHPGHSKDQKMLKMMGNPGPWP